MDYEVKYVGRSTSALPKYAYYCEVGPVGIEAVRFVAIGSSILEASAGALGHLQPHYVVDYRDIADRDLPDWNTAHLPFFRAHMDDGS